MLDIEQVKQIKITQTGARIRGELDHSVWLGSLETLCKVNSASKWAIIDMLIYAQDKAEIKAGWGETYIEGMALTGWTYGHITNVISTGRRFPPSLRMPWPFGVSHHAAVAKLDVVIADKILRYAYDQKMTRDELRELKELNENVESPDEVVFKRGYTEYEQLVLPLRMAAEQALSAYQSGKQELIEQAMRDLELSLNES